jgi:WD40 repeat protein
VFSPDGDTLYTVSQDGTAIAWDLTGRRGLARQFAFTDDPKVSSEGIGGRPGVLSPDGRLIAVGLSGRGVALRDALELEPVGSPLLETGGEVNGLSFSPDGRMLAAVTELVAPGRTEGGFTLTLWDVRARSRIRRAFIWGNEIAFSPDGSTLAYLNYLRGLTLLDAATGATLGEIRAKKRSDLAFSGDGKLIASARGDVGGADVWDVATRRRITSVDAVHQGYAADYAVALSSDGSMLALGGDGSPRTILRIVDVRTGELLHEFDQTGAGVGGLQFSQDDRLLVVTGLSDNSTSLWDVASGTQISARLSVGSRGAGSDLSPDGRRLLMTADNGEGAVWDIDPASWARRACAIANRTLTREEWDEFLPGRPYEPACT